MKAIPPLTGRKATVADSVEGQPRQAVIGIRSSVRDYAITVAALFALLSGAEIVLGQQQTEMVAWTTARLISTWP